MDGHLRKTIRRRSKEIFGIVLLLLATALALAVASYSANDPGLLTSNGNPVFNLLGLHGARAVSPFMITIGMATWCFPAVLFVWGLRFIAHAGGERFASRAIILPFLVLSVAVVAAAHNAPPAWPHHFGAGGMLGDALFGGLSYSWPVGVGDAAVHVTYAAIGATVLLAAAAAGVTVRGFGRFVLFMLLAVSKSLGVMAGFSRRESGAETDESEPAPRRGFSLFRRRPASDRTDAADELYDDEFENDGFDADEFDDDDDEDDDGEPAKDGPGLIGRLGLLASGLGRRKNVEEPPEWELERPWGPGREPTLTREANDTITEFETFAPIDGSAPEADPEPVIKRPTRKPRKQSKRAIQESRPSLIQIEEAEPFHGPPLSLLQEPVRIEQPALSSHALENNARMLESVLNDYGVRGRIAKVRPGPVVTLYELQPEPGLKASRVIGLADDIARNMSALSARISTVPGRNVIGIELPNEIRETVFLRELLADRDFGDSRMELAIALGKDISGEPIIVDLAQMPHLLIAGTTGSGKSVAINTMILSLLYRLSPDQCRLIMIDPKMLELSVYDGIPHLLSPVVTDPKKAVVALKWVVAEMEERYRKMSKVGVRKLTTYNEKVREAQRQGKTLSRRVQTGFDDNGDPMYVEEEADPTPLPYIVVIVDEMADLMMVAGKEIEACIQRLAQMARASGIHVVMATQRPSVDVITGTIKANFPTRVSFQVTTKVDSRTILGEQGAEQLLGRGDMLYMSGGAQTGRIHGPFVADEEVEEVVTFLKQFGEPEYLSDVLEGEDSDVDAVLGLAPAGPSDNAEYDMAVSIVLRDRKCSTSYIQRKMEIGYNKAARLVERMEEENVVSPANHVGKREILVPE